MTDYVLPQNDQNPTGRRQELAAKQTKYVWDFTYGVPVSLKFDPKIDASGPGWVTALVKTAAKIRGNMAAYVKVTPVKWAKAFPPSLKDPRKFLGWVNSVIAAGDIAGEAGNYFLPNLGNGVPDARPKSIDDYKAMFATQELPEIAKRYETDESFGYTFVAGPNPVTLKRMTQIPQTFPITDEHLHKVAEFQGDSLASAISQGRVFYVDYAFMGDLENGVNYGAAKYMSTPLAAFVVPQGGGRLYPFAIQCAQDSSKNPIYTPDQGYSWKIARNFVLAAHNTYHEAIVHLGTTHLLMEPILVACRRQLANAHPVQCLLSHHFEGTMLINNGATHKLIQPGAGVDTLVGASIQSVYPFLKKHRFAFSFTGNYLPNRFAVNKTEASGQLKVYPYRDDALLVWTAVANWCNAFVPCFYNSDADVQADYELQAWAAEVVSPTGGCVKDFGATPGRIMTRQDLAQILTMIIFTAGPQHAAVNFSQKSDMAFVPANPLSCYTPPPTGTGHTEKDYLDNLPPLDVALMSVQLLTLLASIYYTKLGDYSSNLGMVNFTTGAVRRAVENFHSELASVESIINERNKTRFYYPHLLPSLIPQSVNI